jgi:hypothetical protein
MICHHMRTDAPFCILCDVYFRCSEWESEHTKLVVRSQFDCTTISDTYKTDKNANIFVILLVLFVILLIFFLNSLLKQQKTLLPAIKAVI